MVATTSNAPAAAVEHYEGTLALEASAVQAARAAWRGVAPDSIKASFNERLDWLVKSVVALQAQAAGDGATFSAAVLAQMGKYVAPEWLSDPDAVTGWMSGVDAPEFGVALEDAFSATPLKTLRRIGNGMSVDEALRIGGRELEDLAMNAVVSAARNAAAVDITTRPDVYYVRMLNPPSCARCAVLAGRVYRWNDGFKRHPNCDCTHIPCHKSRLKAARDEGLIGDPYEYFESLSEKEQNRIFTKYGAQAIRDGSDIYQVVNARRGLSNAGRNPFTPAHSMARRYTTEGTVRGRFVSNGGTKGGVRLTPEGIYTLAGGDRDLALRMLRRNGYILPEGQVAGGSYRGKWPGFGQDGKGGRNKRAADAISEALATGRRRNRERATMTAAERRVDDARWRWEIAQLGYDPQAPGVLYKFKGVGSKNGEVRLSTPEMIADYEKQYRYLLRRKGQLYIDD